MIQIAAFVIVALGISVALRDKPLWLLTVIIALRVVVPPVAASALFVGSKVSTTIHGATVLVFTAVLVQAVARPSSFYTWARRNALILALLSFILIWGALVTFVPHGIGSAAPYLNTYVAPIAVWMLFGIARTRGETLERNFPVLLALVVAECLLIYAQVVFQAPLVWTTYLEGAGRYIPGQFNRPLGTFDSPIEAGAVLAAAIFVVGSAKSRWTSSGVALLLLTAVVLTGSRVPTICAVVAVLWIVARSVKTVAARLLLILVAAIGSLAYYLLGAPGIAVGRFDSSSADQSDALRTRALTYVLDHISQYAVIGGGFRYGSATHGGVLTTSLENSYAIMAFDFGVVTTVLYLGLQLYIAAFRMGAHRQGGRPAGIASIAMAFATSGFANPSVTGVALWFFLAWAHFGTGVGEVPHIKEHVPEIELGSENPV